MNLDIQIDTLSRILVMLLGGFILIVSAVLIYITWFCLELERQEMHRGESRDKEAPE
jgi:phage shock protein PspC (stress-responsive transcriptional regulator)